VVIAGWGKGQIEDGRYGVSGTEDKN